MEVELTSTRDVHVAGRLIRPGIEVESDHVGTNIVRGVDVLTTEGVRDVVAEELSGNVAVQIDTVRLEQDAVDGGELALVGGLAVNGGERSTELSTGGRGSGTTGEVGSGGRAQRDGREAVEHERIVELGNREDGATDDTDVAEGGQSSHEVKTNTSEGVEVGEVGGGSDTGGHGHEERTPSPAVLQAAQRDALLLNVGVQMPSGRHLGARVVDVLHGAEADVHGLDGPLHLLKQDVVIGLVDTGDLDAVDADQREADALDEDVMDFRIDEDVVDVQLEGGDIRDRHGVDGGLVEVGVVGVALLEDVRGTSEVDVDETLAVRLVPSPQKQSL